MVQAPQAPAALRGCQDVQGRCRIFFQRELQASTSVDTIVIALAIAIPETPRRPTHCHRKQQPLNSDMR